MASLPSSGAGAFRAGRLAGSGAVGGQVLTGLPGAGAPAYAFGEKCAVWPFEPLDAPIAFAEIWPGLINEAVARKPRRRKYTRPAQVRLLANALRALDPDVLAEYASREEPLEEGWILGVGHKKELERRRRMPCCNA